MTVDAAPADLENDPRRMCPPCAARGTCRFGLRAELVDGVVEGRVRFGAEAEVAPGVVHGGLVAAVLDETCGLVPFANGEPAVTARLEVRYRRPVPTLTDLSVRGWVEEHADGRWRVLATIRLAGDDRDLARAEGDFVAMRAR